MKVYGHRGVIYPERPPYQNSIEAFKIALETSDGLECDVCRSSDGGLFLIHEAKYYRNDVGVEYCAEEHLDDASKELIGERKLENMPAEDIKKLRLLDGQPIPTLDDTIPLFTGTDKVLILELKGHDVLEILAERLEKAFARDELDAAQVVIVSFNHPELIRTRKLLPQVRTGATFVKEDQPTAALYPWLTGTEDAVYTPFNPQTAQQAINDIQPDYLVLPHQELNSDTMRQIAGKHPEIGIMIWVFTETIDLNAGKNLSETPFLNEAKEGIEYNLQGIMIDTPEKSAAYKEFIAAS